MQSAPCSVVRSKGKHCPEGPPRERCQGGSHGDKRNGGLRQAKIGPDTIAKLLFTSGSTGAPKGVINTHRMMTSNQAMLKGVNPSYGAEPPVLIDWLRWSHTFGGNNNFNLVLANGGSYYIDEGKPLPDAIEATVRNLRQVSPTVY